MSVLVEPQRPPHHVLPERLRRPLLACGLAGAALYGIGNDVLAAASYDGYSPLSQAVSELSSVGAPTRSAVLVLGLTSDALLVLFAGGVWASARGSAALRQVAALLVAYGALGPAWLPFPMTARDAVAPTTATTDAVHLVLSAATVVVITATIAVGAVAFETWFRWYSAATVLVVLGFGALTGTYVPAVAAGDPTPWMGAFERLGIWAWLLWVAVLAVRLLRGLPRDGAG